jgi:phytanoyl-CoA hydroxylase
MYAGLDWTSRLLRMRQEFPDAPVILIKGGVLPPSLQAIFADDRILDVAAQLGVGPDVALNAAWNLRGKMPAHEETVVPWHQDNSCERILSVSVVLPICAHTTTRSQIGSRESGTSPF